MGLQKTYLLVYFPSSLLHELIFGRLFIIHDPRARLSRTVKWIRLVSFGFPTNRSPCASPFFFGQFLFSPPTRHMFSVYFIVKCANTPSAGILSHKE